MLKRIVLILTVMVLSSFAVLPAVNAAPCNSGFSCIWGDQNFQTAGSSANKIAFQFYIPNFGSWVYANTGQSGANSATSVTNEGVAQRVYYYDNTGCNVFSFSLAVNTGDQHLNDSSGQVPGGHDNEVESGAFDTYRPSC